VNIVGKVIALLKVMPTGVDVDVGAIKEKIKKQDFGKATINSVEIQDIAFGLKALNVSVITDDAEGGTDSVQERLSKIADVASVEVTDIGLL
jgi:elongation factor 1-beta